jgi:hypothetical protein
MKGRPTRSDVAAWLLGAGIAANAELFERVGAAVAEVRRLRGGETRSPRIAFVNGLV